MAMGVFVYQMATFILEEENVIANIRFSNRDCPDLAGNKLRVDDWSYQWVERAGQDKVGPAMCGSCVDILRQHR